jgi:adenosylcobinamide kinase/adenosylcobinamide-phosphate guanylyltransferase
MSITLILGGARSGKSRFAQELAAKPGKRVLFVATAEALDEEMSARIESHKNVRPATWRTLESPRNIARALKRETGDARVIIIDCITLLVSNLMGKKEPEAEILEKRVNTEIENLVKFMKKTKADFIVVSNEVGLGLVPVYPSSRVYRDALGMANQTLAKHADVVYFMMAGIAIPLKGAQS